MTLSVPVADLERTVQFYRDVLSFDLLTVRGRGERVQVHLRAGDVDLVFRSAVGDPAQLPRPGSGEDRVVWSFHVDDVYALYKKISQKEPLLRFVRPLAPTLFGGAEFAIEDVDGRLLEFRQNG